ncbi:hypothetical protein B9Z55_009099 [Caenorhabditis nigoni]|uniref:BTB domain-containing protein n=1 Tax=Caenorhabditis nigoni TaxID=1611254 RepID=A0A2G5UQM1_9PELO|nr:hypothetical protein B9Z55_009099 [Caenorhabditis nigoni]
MSVVGAEKTFIMKHTSEIVSKKTHYSPEEEHFGARWKLQINEVKSGGMPIICLYCWKKARNCWEIESEVTLKVLKADGTWETNRTYSCIGSMISKTILNMPNGELSDYLIDGKLSLEMKVEIKGMTITGASWLRNFDDDVAIEFSDVILVAGTQEFHVNKMYLSMHSTYFKSLFSSQTFTGTKKPIIKLKDVHPQGLQYFLEVLYGEPTIRDYSVDETLELAKKYNAETVIRRCEEFLLRTSEVSRKRKFATAVRYDMFFLKRECLSEAKTTAEIRELAPENAEDFGPKIWKELFLKACSSK